MNILVDMNLSPRWVELPVQSGFSATHWSSIGRGDAADSEIMAHAATLGYVVLTHDLDFGAILAATQARLPSVVQIRARDVSPTVIGNRVIPALRQVEADLDSGAILTIDADRARLRLLPLSIPGRNPNP